MLSHTVALSILLLRSLDRDINKKRKWAITVTKALTAEGKWHVNLSSGRLELAGNNYAPCSARLTALETFPAAVWVCLAVEQGTFFQAAIPTRALRHSSPEPHRLLKYHLQSVLFQISKPPSYIH